MADKQLPDEWKGFSRYPEEEVLYLGNDIGKGQKENQAL